MSGVTDLTAAQEVGFSLLSGAAGGPIGAWVFWQMFKGPHCGDFVGDCVTTISGESYSWYALAGKGESIAFGFALALLTYFVFEGLIKAAKEREAAAQARLQQPRN